MHMTREDSIDVAVSPVANTSSYISSFRPCTSDVAQYFAELPEITLSSLDQTPGQAFTLVSSCCSNGL